MPLKSWTKHQGTSSNFWQIGFKSAKLVATNTLLKFVNNSDTLIRVQGATPTENSDLTTKAYVDGKNEHFITLKATNALAADRLVSYNANGVLEYTTADTIHSVVGVTNAAASAGGNVKISVGPVVTGLTGLTAGKPAYLTASGVISTSTTSEVVVGVAISTTSIVLRPHRVDYYYGVTV